MKAPVSYDRAFIADDVAAAFFDHLWANLPWENRDGKPRRECWFNPYGQPYTYGRGENAETYEAWSFEPDGDRPLVNQCRAAIWSIMQALNAAYGAQFDCCFVNGYAHGRQHLGWHADDSPEMDLDHPIATVSLGAVREIWFRPKVFAAPVERLSLAHGSAAIMHAGMQRDWQHRIPKSPLGDACPPRISLTYRRLVR